MKTLLSARPTANLFALFFVATLLALPGCKSACRSMSDTYCAQCENDLEGQAALQCVCLNNGTLSKDDADDADLDGLFDTDDEAARWCDRRIKVLDSTADDTDAACQATLDFMSKWPDEVCPDPPPSGDDDDDDDDDSAMR